MSKVFSTNFDFGGLNNFRYKCLEPILFIYSFELSNSTLQSQNHSNVY